MKKKVKEQKTLWCPDCNKKIKFTNKDILVYLEPEITTHCNYDMTTGIHTISHINKVTRYIKCSHCGAYIVLNIVYIKNDLYSQDC